MVYITYLWWLWGLFIIVWTTLPFIWTPMRNPILDPRSEAVFHVGRDGKKKSMQSDCHKKSLVLSVKIIMRIIGLPF